MLEITSNVQKYRGQRFSTLTSLAKGARGNFTKIYFDGKSMKTSRCAHKTSFLSNLTPHRVRWVYLPKWFFARNYIKCPEINRIVIYISPAFFLRWRQGINFSQKCFVTNGVKCSDLHRKIMFASSQPHCSSRGWGQFPQLFFLGIEQVYRNLMLTNSHSSC